MPPHLGSTMYSTNSSNGSKSKILARKINSGLDYHSSAKAMEKAKGKEEGFPCLRKVKEKGKVTESQVIGTAILVTIPIGDLVSSVIVAERTAATSLM